MIVMAIESNAQQAIARLEGLARAVEEKATLRAVNRAVDSIATESNRQIRSIYRIKAADVRKAISKRRATRASAVMSGEVVFKGRRLNLIDFGGRQTKKGVSVQVLVGGARKVIPGTFIATNSGSGFRGIFRRVGKARYPIKNLRAIAIPQTVRNKVIEAAIRRVATETFLRTFRQQVKFLAGR